MNSLKFVMPVEPVSFDPDRLEMLYLELGEDDADSMLCRALEEMAVRLKACEIHHREAKFESLRKKAQSLIAIADQIGMCTLVRVASDVVACIDNGDPAALGATLQRLGRIGDQSLMAVWDLQDFPV